MQTRTRRSLETHPARSLTSGNRSSILPGSIRGHHTHGDRLCARTFAPGSAGYVGQRAPGACDLSQASMRSRSTTSQAWDLVKTSATARRPAQRGSTSSVTFSAPTGSSVRRLAAGQFHRGSSHLLDEAGGECGLCHRLLLTAPVRPVRSGRRDQPPVLLGGGLSYAEWCP